ncbi:MAG TPA: IS66 family insertion sequence element accessory protein TnpB [Polyangia bacterium]|jgi:hypothetical protein|nr:IS66 family insertion sequence element accessory protein TnpB [Polyangia bacterium]
MIPHGVEIFVGLDPIDLRWSFDRLAGIVAERIGRDAHCGAMFVFFGKRREAIKVALLDAGRADMARAGDHMIKGRGIEYGRGWHRLVVSLAAKLTEMTLPGRRPGVRPGEGEIRRAAVLPRSGRL